MLCSLIRRLSGRRCLCNQQGDRLELQDERLARLGADVDGLVDVADAARDAWQRLSYLRQRAKRLGQTLSDAELVGVKVETENA